MVLRNAVSFHQQEASSCCGNSSSGESLSSTFTRPPCKMGLPPHQDYGTVRFDETRNQEYSAHDAISQNDEQLLWYTSNDFLRFRATATALARAMVQIMDTAPPEQPTPQANQQLHQSSDEVVDDSSDDDDSYRGCLLRLWRASLHAACDEQPTDDWLSPEDQCLLRKWLPVCVTRVGMERWLVSELVRDKKERYQRLVRRVREVQAMEFHHQQERRQTLRLACEKISRPSRLWARELARALVVQEEEYNNHRPHSSRNHAPAGCVVATTLEL